MENKQELIETIESLPEFELKEVASKVLDDKGWDWMQDERKRVITEKCRKEILTLVSDRYELTQFKEVYNKILNEFKELNGFVRYYRGKGVLVIYPEGHAFEIDEDNFKGRIGLLIANSVDTSSAVSIKFVVSHGDYSIIVPHKKEFKALHIEGINRTLEGYNNFISNIKGIWKTIVQKLRDRFLDEEETENLFKDLRISKRIRKEIREEVEDRNLWGLFIALVEKISKKNYKNKINQIEKLKKISQICYEYAIVEEL